MPVTRKWSQTSTSVYRQTLLLHPRTILHLHSYLENRTRAAHLDKPADMVLAATSLTSLPPELMLEISEFLAPDGILALKLTHRKFNETLPFSPQLKNTPFSDCAHLAIRNYLSRPNLNPSHLRCMFCKKVYPASLFRSSSSPACVPVSWEEDVEQTEVVELPQRLCSWHVGRLTQVIHTERDKGWNEWTSVMDEMCMHCGAIQGWAKCDCDCDSCAIRPVRTYTRYLDNDDECRTFLFWKGRAKNAINSQDNARNSQDNVKDRLWVRETCKSRWQLSQKGKR
jgi:hypothetical protein